MWDADHFPGAKNVPWQLLIRARYVHEVDAVLASAVQNALGSIASAEVVELVSRAAIEGTRLSAAEPTEARSEVRSAAIVSVVDFDEYCGTPYPHHPRPHWINEFGDAVTPTILQAAARLVATAGSPSLQMTLGAALGQVGVRV